MNAYPHERRSRASFLRHASRPIRTPQDAKSTYGGALITIGFHFGKPTDGEVQLRTADRCITQLNQVQEAPW